MKNLSSLLALLLLLTILPCSAQRKAIFIIVDGIPADVIEKVSTPVIDEISKQGGYTRSYQGGEKGGYSQSPTISAVGYNNVLTGTWTSKHNVWDNDIAAPNYNYWNIFRIAKTVKPEIKTAIFSTWLDNRTKLVGEGLPTAGNIKLDYAYDGLELDTIKFPHTKDAQHMFNIDEAVSAEAGRYILENGPDLSWVYLEFTDDMGHMYGDSPQMTDAVQKADAQVGRIWNAIKEREKKFGEEWMILVTTDHGRTADTGKNHGGQSDRERITWITTNVKPLNAHFKETPAAVDIAPSILSFLKIKAPEAVRNEFDGSSFVGSVSVSNLRASRNGDKVMLKWNVLNAKGKAEVMVSYTNDFKTGQTDLYTSLGKINVSAGAYEFSLPEGFNGFCKIMLIAPDNTLTYWITGK